MTREQYMESQPEAEKGAKHFEKLDTNKDGVITREEFLAASAK